MSRPQFVDHLVSLFFTRCRQILEAKYQKENVGLNPLAFGVVTIEELQSVRTRPDQTLVVHSGIGTAGSGKDRYGQKDFIWLGDPDNVRTEFYFRPWS
jgi:glyoxylase I family protein